MCETCLLHKIYDLGVGVYFSSRGGGGATPPWSHHEGLQSIKRGRSTWLSTGCSSPEVRGQVSSQMSVDSPQPTQTARPSACVSCATLLDAKRRYCRLQHVFVECDVDSASRIRSVSVVDTASKSEYNAPRPG